MTLPPIGVGSVIAVIVLIAAVVLAIMGAADVKILAMIGGLAIARLVP